ncbi:MAG: patatin-like phospholipase family protein [Chitinophagaceae bacterium]
MKKRKRLLLWLMLPLIPISVVAQSNRVLSISGGGSRGAWGGGVAKQLVLDSGWHYQAIFGTSSGSLLAPMIVLGYLTKNFDNLETGFTDIDQNTIFNKNPFKKNGEVKGFSTLLKLLFGGKNLGETYNLKKRINEFFSPADYERLRQEHTIVVSTVSLTTNQLVYRSSDSIPDYDHMVNCAWASANQPIFMTPVPMFGELWVDGGVKETVPVKEAINYARAHKIDSVDVIVLNTPAEHREKWPAHRKKDNIIAKILRVFTIFSDEIKVCDIEIGIRSADAGNKVFLQFYFMNEGEYGLAPNGNLFIRERQKQLFEKGYTRTFTSNKALGIKTQEINNVKITIFD